MQLASYAWLLAGITGHLALCVVSFNRSHALGLSHHILRAAEKLYLAAAVGVPVYWAYRLLELGLPRDRGSPGGPAGRKHDDP
jgi:hypothetical protein